MISKNEQTLLHSLSRANYFLPFPTTVNIQPLWRTVWRFLKKLEIELPYDPAIPLLGIQSIQVRDEGKLVSKH